MSDPMTTSSHTADETAGHVSLGITLNIVVAGEAVFEAALSRPMELGRQRMDEAGPYSLVSLDDSDRLVIAELGESTVSRRHVALEPLSNHCIRVKNLSSVNTIWIDSRKPLATHATCEVNLPTLLTLSNVDLAILVYASPGQDESLQSLAQPTVFPGVELAAGKRLVPSSDSCRSLGG